MKEIIQVKNIKKYFNEGLSNEFKAFEDVSFCVNTGDIFALKGVSGSGKSTLLSLIAGIYKPTDGEMLIDGENIAKLSLKFATRFRRKNIGMIFQNFNLIPTLSVFDNVVLPSLPDIKKSTYHDFEKRAFELLYYFSLSSKKNIHVRFLSGGEQQRVAIARALINDPKIILADEPTANLDTKLSNDLMVLFKEIKDMGKTIVVASHDPLILQSNQIDDMYVLNKG